MGSLLRIILTLILLTNSGLTSSLAEGLRPLTPDEGKLLKELNRPRRIVLAIGIDKFEDAFWNPLKFASSDADRFYRFLRQEARLPFDAGELITTRSGDGGQVSRQTVMHALERLKALNISEEDSVVIYLSTHGTIYLRKNENIEAPNAYVPYFVMSDTQHQNIQDTALSREDLVQAFQGLKSQRKALIIASCHSGGGKAQITPEIREALKRLKGDVEPGISAYSGRGFSILAAASWSEPAVEDDKLQQDIYTHFLIAAMRANQDRVFTLSQAHESATRETIAYTRNLQHPTIQLDQSGGDPIILSGSSQSHGLAFLYSYMNSLRNFELRIGGQSKGLIGETSLTVPEGKHRLEIIDPATQKVVASRVIRIHSGKEYSIADLILARNRWHGSIGPGYSHFIGTAFTERFAPEAAPQIHFQLAHDEALGLYDLILSGSYSPWQQETVRLERQDFRQRRSSSRLFLGIGARERLHLFAQSEQITSEWGWSAGPGVLSFKRQIEGDERIAVEKARAEVILPGLGISTHLRLLHGTTGLEYGISAQFDVFANSGQVQRVGPAIFQSQIAAYVGVGW